MKADTPTRKHRLFTVGDTFGSTNLVPLLRLKGNWLARSGFVPGARVAATIEDGQIVLVIIHEVEEGER